MNEGVQILLERMKTHPEEFTPEYDGGVTKWGNAIGQYRTYLMAEDNKALDDAWKQAVGEEMQRRFTQRVMEELVDPKWLQREQRDTLSGGQTQGQLWAQSQLQQAQATQAHIQLHQQQLAAQNQATQFNGLVGAGQGYLSALFGGNK